MEVSVKHIIKYEDVEITLFRKSIGPCHIYSFTNQDIDNGGGVCKIKVGERTIEGTLGFSLDLSPTGNCQIKSLKYCNSIIQTCQRVYQKFNYDGSISYEDKKVERLFIHILKDISKITLLKMIMLDVHDMQSRSGVVDSTFEKKYITFRQPYTSTINSRMVMYLINMKKYMEDNGS